MKYRLYYATSTTSYKQIAEHQNLDFIRKLAQQLNGGKYMIILKSPKGDEVVEFRYLKNKNDIYDLADSPKIKRRIKYKKGEKKNERRTYKL